MSRGVRGGPHGRRHGRRGLDGQGGLTAAEEGLVTVDGGSIVEPDEGEFEERRRPRALLREHRRRRSAWLSHLRSFIGVNAGLAAINLITGLTAESLYPWFLYVTASWGIGLVIHGLEHRGWVRDHDAQIRRARMTVEQIDEEIEALPESGAPGLADRREELSALPSGDGGWGALLAECSVAVGAAQEALSTSGVDEVERGILCDKLDRSLKVVEDIRRGALAVGAALVDVAPDGGAALQEEISALEEKIGATNDDRLKGVYTANRRLLEARQDKVRTLEAEQERMRATVEGFLLATQNLRLDAARLGTGQVPDLLGLLSDSLERLDDEVEVARQVESELEKL